MLRRFLHPPWPLHPYRNGNGARPWIDRAELDALFALRHPLAANHRFLTVTRHVLRADPSLLLLDVGSPDAPPETPSLRFC